jgi:hypothetical protein
MKRWTFHVSRDDTHWLDDREDLPEPESGLVLASEYDAVAEFLRIAIDDYNDHNGRHRDGRHWSRKADALLNSESETEDELCDCRDVVAVDGKCTECKRPIRHSTKGTKT